MTIDAGNEPLGQSSVVRTIQAGGLSKIDLMNKLNEKDVFINELGKQLLMDERMSVSQEMYELKTIELSVGDLGLTDGAVLPAIYEQAIKNGLFLCPLEAGPYVRLAYLDQPEGYTDKPLYEKRAPYGSITIASEKVDKSDDFPRGFYIRKIEGSLWLRGYVADDLHKWHSNDRFLFCCSDQ